MNSWQSIKKYRWFIIAGVLVISLAFARFASYEVIETWSSDKSSTQIRLIRRPATPFFLIPPWERVQMVYQQRQPGQFVYENIISEPHSSSYTMGWLFDEKVWFKGNGNIEIIFVDTFAETFDDGNNWLFTKR